MMQTFEECLVMYRHRLRQMLHEAGVRSNPGVDDSWILDQIQELLSKRTEIQQAEPTVVIREGRGVPCVDLDYLADQQDYPD